MTTLASRLPAALGASLASLLALAGCQMAPVSLAPLSTTKFTLQQTEKLMLLDRPTQEAVSSTGIQHSVLPDGRMQVVVNIKNRQNQANRVQLSTVFRDTQGISHGDETPWETLTLSQNATEAVRFVSETRDARQFTVRVRKAPSRP